MGDRSADILHILIAILAVTSLIALAFALFSITKGQANNKQGDLVNQLADISQSIYTDLNNQTVTGARVKQAVKQAKHMDCAILVNTLSLSGAMLPVSKGDEGVSSLDDNGRLTGREDEIEIDNSIKKENSINGALYRDVASGKSSVPFVMLENFPLITGLGTRIYQGICVNYGSILNNSIVEIPNGSTYKSILKSADGSSWEFGDAENKISGYGKSCEFGQTIAWDSDANSFITKLPFATDSQTSRILRYDDTSDFEKKGSCMEIGDTAVYNSYVLKNIGGDYMGLVFIQHKEDK